MKRRGVLRVTHEAIFAAFGLSTGARVVRVLPQDEHDAASDVVKVLLEGDAMPTHLEGTPAQFVELQDVVPRYIEGR